MACRLPRRAWPGWMPHRVLGPAGPSLYTGWRAPRRQKLPQTGAGRRPGQHSAHMCKLVSAWKILALACGDLSQRACHSLGQERGQHSALHTCRHTYQRCRDCCLARSTGAKPYWLLLAFIYTTQEMPYARCLQGKSMPSGGGSAIRPEWQRAHAAAS